MNMGEGTGSAWSDAEVLRVVAAIMRNDHALSYRGREDRYAVDGLIHAYRALSGQDEVRKRIGEAVAGYLRTGSTMERAIALSFYNSCMSAWGGQVLGELAAAEDDGFERTTPVPIGGVTGKSMREALFYAAFSWNGGEGVTDGMLAVAKEDALTGHGEASLRDLSRIDSAWFSRHEETLLSIYEKAIASVWRARVEAGSDPMGSLEALKSHLRGAGHVSLRMTIRFYRGIDAAQKTALLEALDGETRRAAPASGPAQADRRHVTLQEATAGMLGEVRVGCGNFWDRDVADDAGGTVSKMSAKLHPFGADAMVIYNGMSVEVGGVHWQVEGFSTGIDGRGRVEFSTLAS
jgi:hypothetical protein